LHILNASDRFSKPAETFGYTLRCSIIQYGRLQELSRADDSRHYSAVSYTWGDEPASRVLICASNDRESREGFELLITPNVNALLRRLREAHKPIYLRLDAICLNQQDEIEKSQQIPLMEEIYKAARKVYLWLGEDKGQGRDTLALVRRLNSEPELTTAETALITKFLRRWRFGRRWLYKRWH